MLPRYVGRRSRWSSDREKFFTPLPFTHIPNHLNQDEFEILISKHYSLLTTGRQRLDDVINRLNLKDWEDEDQDLRSPSPEPIYDPKTNNRINTRDVRVKEKYIREKNAIIESLLKLDSSYVPPPDYRPPKKVKKLYVPDLGPEYNFVGLILGPGGSTQRELEKKTKCKISIRGKGSNWVNVKLKI